MSSLRSRWQTMPRAMKWAVMGVLGIIIYFAGVEPLIDLMVSYQKRADSAEATLARFAEGGKELEQASMTISEGTRRHGSVEPPGDPEHRALELNKAVDKVLSDHNIAHSTSTSRVSSFGSSGPLTAKVGVQNRLERITKQLDFEAEPEDVVRVIADLERLPVVATISAVQIRQKDARDKTTRTVQASLTIEAWQVSKKGKSR